MSMSYRIGYRLVPAAIQKAFASRGVLLAVIVLTLLWTVFKGQDRKIELSFLFFLVIGGELYEEGIRRLFHSLHPVHAPLESHVLYPFPSEQTLTAFVIFGFCAYLFVRHSHKVRLQTVAFFCLLSFYSSSGWGVCTLMSSIRVMLLRVTPSAVFGWV
ncbi:hypothetical protein RFN65_09210 [Bacillus subtilis]|nr:hypothetical protein [Bacillus subtilis]WMW44966.1 hypothetical protein RFN65_09210 [Bacillus subtilis]